MKKQNFFAALLAGALFAGAPLVASAQTGAPMAKKADANLLQMSALSTNHTTLMKAMKAAGLDAEASKPGHYTVFAPTDSAFAKLPAGALDNLLKPENKKKLAGILTYHVVKGDYLAANLQDGQQLTTVEGETITVMRQGNSVMLKDASGNTAKVINTDIMATNGIVHSIDGVLMPTK